MSGRHPSPSGTVLRWVTEQVAPHGAVVAVTPLDGGTSAAMDRITVQSVGRVDVVLRRWPDEDGTAGLVEQESEALAAAQGLNSLAPALIAADPDGRATGERCTLTTFLPGQPDLQPSDLGSWLMQFAQAQARIHALTANVPARFDGRFVHGDYQPYNALWASGQLSGIVDWPHAAMGSRGADVGHCRLNLAVLFGPAAAAEYLTEYEQAAGVRIDRRADLQSLLCYTDDWPQFIPRQIAGRATIDIRGMANRVVATVRAALDDVDV